jgi:hypothetical protein
MTQNLWGWLRSKPRSISSGFYEVRWFGADDRGELIEMTHERFHCESLHRPPGGICVAEQ